MSRALKPKPTIAVSPLGVSQMNVAAVYGVDPRRFLELVVPHCRNVARIGKLRVVAADEVARVLRELGADASVNEAAEGVAAANDDASAARCSGDDVLRRLGFTRTGRTGT